MKKIFFAVICVGVAFYFFGCSKVSNTQDIRTCNDQPASYDSAALLQFAKSDSITVTKDTSGMYYQIIDTGNGGTPTITSMLTVTYTATFLNGVIFDSATNSVLNNYTLSQLIRGWQLGLPKIRENGRIKLLLPSTLAYGCAGAGNIVAPNTPVYFDITLLHVR